MKEKAGKIVIVSIIISSIIVAIIGLISTNTITQKKSISNIGPKYETLMQYEEFASSAGNFVETPNVTFSAFFPRDEKDDDGLAEKYDGTCNQINSKATMFMDLNVMNEGYLKDGATVTIQSNNFNYSMFMIRDSILKSNCIGNDITEIKFNRINPGSQKIIFGNIVADIENNTNNYSDVNKIIFDGIYVDANNQEIPLHKEIELNVDWYGTVQTKLNTSGTATYYYDNITSNQIKFSFTGNEILNQILLKDVIATATIPQLNGYDAISVEPSTPGIDYEFENGILTMTKSSTIDDNGIITSSLSRANTFTVNVTYPPEAYEAINSYTELKVPVTCKYVGYNNPDEQFTEMSTSNTATGVVIIAFTKRPETIGYLYSHSFDVWITNKQYVSKPNSRYIMSKQDLLNLYDNADYEGNYLYIVRWYAYSGNVNEINSFTLSETTNEGNAYGDKFDEIVLDEYTANKGIYFSNLQKCLGEDGELKVYNNDTNELIQTFNKDNWNTYNSNNIYEYSEPIKHIRIETSKPIEKQHIYVYNVKEFDAKKITENITKEQLEQASKIYTYLTGVANIEGIGASKTNDVDSAYLVSEISDARISLSVQRASTFETSNETIYIDTITTQLGDAKWKNGEFIVEVPPEILNMEINNITINKQDVDILAWDLYKENGRYLIKIITSNANETTYKISINCTITPDSRIASGNRIFNLYAYNEKCNNYYVTGEDIYDVDDDSLTNELVGKSNCSLELLSPTSLVTLETVSDYNDENEVTIAPNVAAVEKDKRTAKINLSLRNNYPYTVAGITILGKIPFEGNTYILQNNKDMKSEFDSSFATAEQLNSNDVGIQSSMSVISQNMTVYYSENENPTKDLTDVSNGWVLAENVQDISKMKTYLVKLNDYELTYNQEATLYYWVYLPEGLDYNSVSYCDHAVYYDFVTDGGRLPLSTEPAKVGVKIVDKYDLNLTKFKINSSLTIPNVTYSLTYTDKDTEGNNKEYSRILTTDSNGKITVNNLYANITYTLKEVKVPDTCELSDNIVTFMIDENGELHLTGTVKNSSFENKTTLKLQLEDEIKANLQITKTKNGTSTRINNVRFSLTDSDGNVKSASTQNGIITLTGLSLNKQYTLKEVSGPNNIELKTGSLKFTLTRAEGGVKVNISENGLGVSLTNANSSNIVAEVDGQSNEILNPTIGLGIQNEVRYTLELNKKDNSNNIVQGAQFIIKGRGFKTEGSKYTTTKFGTFSISGLYVGSEYTLEEISAPGYYIDPEANNTITFTVSRSGNLVVTSSNGAGITVVGTPTISNDNAESLNPKLNITVENEKIPTYNLKLIKENDKGENLVGAQFKLKSLDTGKEEVLTIEQEAENTFEELYEFIAEKPYVTGEYELTEIYAPEGYKLDMTPIKFKATRDEITGVVNFNLISGGNNIKTESGNKVIVSDENTITITLVNKPIFNLTKKGENDVLLPNAKFTITDLEGNAVTGSDGEIVGTLENGKYVLTTDSQGKITANLSEGLYKAVEVEAPEGYELPENEEDRTYLFGIGTSRNQQTNDVIDKLEWARAIGSDYISEFKDVIATQDGGVIAVGSTDVNTYVDKGSSINGYGNQDGIIVKYDANGNVVWQKLFGGRGNDEFFAIAEDSVNGGYVVVGYNFAHDAASDTTGNCIKYDGTTVTGLGNFGSNDGVILKITEDGSLSWCQSIGGTRIDRINAVAVNEYGDVAVTGSFYETIYMDSTKSESLTSKGEKDAFISVYDSTGTLKWFKNLGSSNGDAWGNAIATTSDNGFVVGVNFLGTLEIGGSNNITVASKRQADGALVAYNAEGTYKWYKQIGSINNDVVYDVIDYESENENIIVVTGGYACPISDYSLATPNSSCYDGFIIKFDESGTYKSSMNIGGNRDEVISSIVPTKDGGLLLGGWMYSTSSFTFKGQTFQATTSNSNVYGYAPNDGFIIELDSEDNLVWKDQIRGSLYESVNGVAQTTDGSCFAVGDFEGQSVTVMNKAGALKNVLSYDSDGFVVKYGKSITQAAIPDSAEILVNNELKKYTITTEVGPNEKNNNQRIGGTITGKYTNEYIPSEFIQFVENVKHGDNSTQAIVIKPITDYAIIEITINGEKIAFSPDANGIVTLPIFENVKENKHIIVKFGTENHTIRIKKENENNDPLKGATFEIKSNNDTPVLGELTAKGDYYEEIRADKKVDLDIETSIMGTLTQNGTTYNVEDKTKEVTNNVLGAISDNENEYTFISNGNGGYVSTPDIKGKAGTANSYFEIDLTDSEYEGKNYVVVVNANISSRQSYDFGYATITTSNTSAPAYNTTSGRFIYIAGTGVQQTTPTDYRTNNVLQGGNKYYLYLGYRKASTSSSGNDEFTVNSIKVYETKTTTYGFVENNGIYTPNNIDSSIYYNGNSRVDTIANSYIPIDLTGKEGKNYFVVINAQASSTISTEYLYATINQSTTAPSYSTSAGRFLYGYNVTSTTNNISSLLEGGQTYYLHLGYVNSSSGTTDIVRINSIDLYEASTYCFEEVDDGEGNISYVSNNAGKNSTYAYSYISVDLTNSVGDYKITLEGTIAGETNDYAFATVQTDTTRQAYNTSTNRFVYQTGENSSVKNVSGNTTVVGGQMYYIHLGYYNNTGDSTLADNFTVTSVKVEPVTKTYTATTDSNGIAIVEVDDLGKYQITETEAPEHYIKSDEIKDVELTSSSKNVLFTFTDRAVPRLIVHRYYKDSEGNYTTIKVAEDEANEGVYNEEYATSPYATITGEPINLDGLTLEKVEGEYVVPANAVGTYGDEVTEVTYYFEAEPITLKINHLEEGTDTKLAEETVVINKIDYEFDEQFNHTVSSSFDYDLDSNADYNTLKEQYIYVTITTQSDDENGNKGDLNYPNVEDTFTYSNNSEITYYYNKKVHTITSEVEPHKENRTDSAFNTKIEVDVDGGTITGVYNSEYLEENDIKFVENVKDKENAKTVIKTTPDEHYSVEYIELTADPEGEQPESKVIYGTKTIQDGNNTTIINAETIEGVTVTTNAQGVVSVSALKNITEDKHFTTRFTPEEGTVTIHHIIKGATPEENVEYSTSTITDLVGEPYSTGPITIENYRMIESEGDTTGEYIDGNIDVYYYYDINLYEYSVEYYYNNVLDSNMTESGDEYKARYEAVINSYPTQGKAKDGYVFDHVEKVPLIISDDISKNVIKVYYVKRADLDYTVHYRELGVDGDAGKLADDKYVDKQTFGNTITENAIDINGYDKVAPTSANIEITTGTNEHTFYYTKRNDLDYTVHYRELGVEGVAGKLADDKYVDEQTFGDVIPETAIDIPGYDKVAPTSANIEITTGTNEHTFYYTKRNDLDYTVHYRELGVDGDEGKLAEDKYRDGQTFGDIIPETAIDIPGYNKVAPTSANIEITAGINEHTFYYTRRDDLSYIVHYRELGVDGDEGKLADDKEEPNQTFGDIIPEIAIDIPGYDKVAPTSANIEITTGTNEHTFYYTKRNDLSYTVHYRELGVDGDEGKLAEDKYRDGKTFGDVISESAIDINGYVKLSPTTTNIEITAGTNEYTFYYTKRDDLSYIVKYWDKDENVEIKTAKPVSNKAYQDVIQSSTEVIQIDGYTYDSLSPETLTIGTDPTLNIINIYYIKRNDLDYTVHYRELGVEGDEGKLAEDKYRDGQTFRDIIPETAIDIPGYNKVAPTSANIEITTGTNEHTFYYTKRNDLSYTVHYRELGVEGDAGKLADDKTVTRQTFGDTIPETAIDIPGYDKVAPTSANIEITAGTNEYTFYYTKRSNLSYTVKYWDKDDEVEIKTAKTVPNKTYKDVIQSSTEIIDIIGYEYDSLNPATLTIEVNEASNIINIYYVKTRINYEVEKSWDNITSTQANNFKTTFTLMKKVGNGNREAVKDASNHDVTCTITGNGTYTFPSLVEYENGTKIEYSVEETKVEKVNGGEVAVSTFTVLNTKPTETKSLVTNTIKGEFGLNINKTEDVTNGPLKDAKFTISIKDEQETELVVATAQDTEKEFTTGADGKLTEGISGIQITAPGKTYTVTITETEEVEGYRRLAGPITFEVTSKLNDDGTKFVLTPFTRNVANSNGVTVEENSILVNIENEKKVTYSVHYFYDGVEDEDAVINNIDAKFGDVITTYTDKVKDGYKLEKVEPADPAAVGTENANKILKLVIQENSDDNVINVYYIKDQFQYTVKYRYDGIFDETETIQNTADYKEKITVTSPVTKTKNNKEYYKTGETNNPLEITSIPENNVIIIDYVSQYNIKTKVIPHEENYSDGTKKTNVKGGTISGDSAASYEKVLKGKSNTKAIVITPADIDNDGKYDYEIVSVTLNGEKFDYKAISQLNNKVKVDSKGKVTIEAGYFENVNENKSIEVEFRKKTKVKVQYLEAETEKVLYKTDDNKEFITIEGYEGKEFVTEHKTISKYKDYNPSITIGKDGKVSDFSQIVLQADVEGGSQHATGTMYADEITIIYWYEKISVEPEETSIVEKHIEIDEKGNTKELYSKTLTGETGETVKVSRKEYEGYISVDGPKNTNNNIIVAKKTENSITATYVANNVPEVWFYYEKQFDIVTEVKLHNETIVDKTTGEKKTVQVAGGTISKEYKKDESEEYVLDDKGNKIEEDVYEKVLNRGNSKKEIIIEPDDGYRVKSIIINEEPQSLDNFEIASDNSITLLTGYFKDIKEDIKVIVEFEKIPAKLIVKYLDKDTNEEIIPTEETNGFVGDDYKTSRKTKEGYVTVDDDSGVSGKVEGKLSKEDTIVIYYYTKQYKITTDVIEHYENKEKDVIDIVSTEKDENKESSKDNTSTKPKTEKVLVKGGSISGEDKTPYETVNRGKDNTKEIVIKPDAGYRIKYVKIKEPGKDIEELDVEKLLLEQSTEKQLSKDKKSTTNKTIKLSAGYFKDMQSDKHVIVEFEKIPRNIIVSYIEKETETPVAKTESAIGYINDKYKTHEKDVKYYELLTKEMPENAEGVIGEEDVSITYFYRRLLFNMSIKKQFTSILVNGTDVLKSDDKLIKLDIANNELDKTSITVNYKIIVKNTKEVAGKAVIVEQIPVGFKFVNNEAWKLKEKNIYEIITPEIAPGKSMEYNVTLEWDKDLKCIGNLENIVKITKTENEPDFKETTQEDNKDTRTLIISIRTGKDRTAKLIISYTCYGLAAILTMYYLISEIRIRKKKE